MDEVCMTAPRFRSRFKFQQQMGDKSINVKPKTQCFEEAAKDQQIMCLHSGHFISNLDDAPQLPHQPVTQKILNLGASDLSLLSNTGSEVKNTTNIPSLETQTKEIRTDDFRNKATVQGMDPGPFSNEVQPNFDNLRLDGNLSCCISEHYNSFIYDKEKVINPNTFSGNSAEEKSLCAMNQLKRSVQMKSKCRSTLLPCALYEEPVPKKLEVACANFPPHYGMRNPKFCKFASAPYVTHAPDNVYDGNFPGRKDMIHRQNDQSERYLSFNASPGFKNPQNDQLSLTKKNTYRCRATTTNALVDAEAQQKMVVLKEEFKDSDVNDIRETFPMYPNLCDYQEDQSNEILKLAEKLSLNEVLKTCKEERANTEFIAPVEASYDDILNSFVTKDSNVSNKIEVQTQTSNIDLDYSERKDFGVQEYMNTLKKENYLSSSDIFNYLLRQDAKILTIQNQVSHLLALQANDKGTCNKTFCEQIPGDVVNKKLSSIHDCLKKLEDRNNSACLKEVSDENFEFLNHFKAQNEQIRKLQDKLNLFLKQAHEEPCKSKSFNSHEVCERNVHSYSSFAGKINPGDVIQKTANDTIHEAQKDVFVAISPMKSSKLMETYSTSKVTSCAINKDGKLFCSEILMAGTSKSEKKCYHSFPKDLLHRNKIQFNEEKCAYFSKIDVGKTKSQQTFISAQYSSFTNELNDLSLAYKCFPIWNSVSATNSVHLDFKQLPGSLCCENYGDCSMCILGEQGNEIMSALSKNCSIASVYDDILMNVNKVIQEQNHQCQNKATILYCLCKALKLNVSYMTSIISKGTTCNFMNAKANTENAQQQKSPCTSAYDGQNDETFDNNTSSKMKSHEHAGRLSVTRLSSENSQLQKSSYTSLYHMKSGEACYATNVPHEMSRDKHRGRLNIAKYGLSSPNLSMATKDYLENYNLVHSKFS